jgi:hypothetical protein
MTARLILATDDEVKAVLDGRMTVTRRAVGCSPAWEYGTFSNDDQSGYAEMSMVYTFDPMYSESYVCPYGKPGDHLLASTSIFDQKEFVHIKLEIINIEVERLHEIGVLDIFTGGIVPDDPFGPIRQFAEYWDRLNAKWNFGWETNPWVYVITFRKVDE